MNLEFPFKETTSDGVSRVPYEPPKNYPTGGFLYSGINKTVQWFIGVAPVLIPCISRAEDPAIWLWVKNGYPKWLALGNGAHDYNRQSNFW